ncbi:hypothetical protein Pan181_23860 [Aeoliella mucimassa]|uniref:Uncharacterized protein n=1 Tax=Aeoliella mucimassa TaxID=2527972 RepID=A0A518ANA6_9BACT|nr:hypothetical protein Pan181_23860 [Aeoliella mucimassa]
MISHRMLRIIRIALPMSRKFGEMSLPFAHWVKTEIIDDFWTLLAENFIVNKPFRQSSGLHRSGASLCYTFWLLAIF